MRLFKISVIVCTLLVLPALASAQAKRGDAEVAVGGSLFSVVSTGSSTSSGQFNFGVGYFVTDRFEVGIAPTLRVSADTQKATPEVRSGNIVILPGSPGGTTWDVDAGLTTKGQFFFGAQGARVKPYAGGTLTIQSFKTPEGGKMSDNLYSGALFGVKSYLNEKTAIDFSGEYGFRTSAPGEFQLLQMNIGFTYLF
jgi:hypothetical protein